MHIVVLFRMRELYAKNPFLAVLWMFSRFELSSSKPRSMLFDRFNFQTKVLSTINLSTPSSFFQFLVV